MVAAVRPLVKFLDDEIVEPSEVIHPRHDPLRAAFVPYSSGLLMNEMKSYLEWLAARGDFSWMNEDWEYVEDLYSYWPFLRNTAGTPIDNYYFAYHPSVVCALIRVSDNSFFPEGVVVLDGPPDLGLAELLETKYPEKGITRLNMSVVPLEMIDLPEESVESVIYYWATTLQTMDWSIPRNRIDTMVYWSNLVRDQINELIPKESPSPRGVVEKDRYIPTTQEALRIHGLVFDMPTYVDPVTSSSFMGDLRRRIPELPVDASIEDVSQYFRTGYYMRSLGNDPAMYHKLNAILCTYPDEIQERLSSGVVTSLNPRDAGMIGAGFRHGAAPSREGQVLLTYEELRQPRP